MILAYLAGPITAGDQFANVSRAISVREKLKVATPEVAVYVPHRCALDAMIHPAPNDPKLQREHYEYFMKEDFEFIRRSTCLIRLPGKSSGSDREVAFASGVVSIPVFHGYKEFLAFYTHYVSPYLAPYTPYTLPDTLPFVGNVPDSITQDHYIKRAFNFLASAQKGSPVFLERDKLWSESPVDRKDWAPTPLPTSK